MKLHQSWILVLVAICTAPAVGQQLISNPGIDGPAGDSPVGTSVHSRNSWNGVSGDPVDSIGKWWTGAVNEWGHCDTGGNGDGNFCGPNPGGFINRFQIIDNTSNQYSGPAEFSYDRQWYHADFGNTSTFTGVKWMIFGINGIGNLPPGYSSMTSGGQFGLNGGTGDLLADYNHNDINGTATDGDGIIDTGNMGADWLPRSQLVDLGSTPYDYYLVIFRAGSTAQLQVPVRFDNVKLTLVPEPATLTLLAASGFALTLFRRR